MSRYIKKSTISKFQQDRILKHLGYNERGKKKLETFMTINEVNNINEVNTLLISMYNLAIKLSKKEKKEKNLDIIIKKTFTYENTVLEPIESINTIDDIFYEMEQKDLKNKLYIINVEYFKNKRTKYEGVENDISYYTITMNTTNLTSLHMNRLRWLLTSSTDKPFKPYTFLQHFKKGSVILSIKAVDEVKQDKELQQEYKFNDTGTCVYDACISYFANKPKDRNAIANYNKLIENKEKWAKSYTDNNLHTIAEFLGSSIVIRNLITGKNKVFNEKPNNKFRIEMINTKYDHLDLLIDLNKNIIEVEEDEYNQIKGKAKFYIEEYGKLVTLNGIYTIKKTEFQLLYKEWKNKVNYSTEYITDNSDEYKLIKNYDYSLHTFFTKNIKGEYELDDDDDLETYPTDEELCLEFIAKVKKAYKIENSLPKHITDDIMKKLISGWDCSFAEWLNHTVYNWVLEVRTNDKPDFIDWEDIEWEDLEKKNEVLENDIINEDLYVEKDLKKAYYLYPDYHLYCGIPSGAFINVKCDATFDFKKLLNNKLIGFFQVKIIKSNLDKRIGFTNNTVHTLFTSTIVLLLNNGVELEFMNASYAPAIDIKFNETLLQQGDNKLKHYCKAYGIMLCDEKETTTYVKPLDDDLNFYKTIVSDELSMYKNNNLISIVRKKPFYKSYIHFAYAIHAYCRTQMLEQMIQMNMDDVFGVKVDSLVIKKECKHIFPKTFASKDCNLQGMNLKLNSTLFRPYFQPTFIDIEFKQKFLKEHIINKVVFLGGAGGTGKTYTLLSNLELSSTVFSSFCWDLIQDKSKEFNVSGATTKMLIGDECEKINKSAIRHIVVDELTLIDETVINKIIKDYPSCFIYLVGDIDYNGTYYQCSCGNQVIKPKDIDCQYLQFTKSYRFNETLQNILTEMRNVVKKSMVGYKKIDELKTIVLKYFSKNEGNYDKDDIGVASTKQECKELTNTYISKGANEKYFVTATNKKKQLYKGAETTKENGDLILFKTIHSFQGRQLNMNNKIFVSLNNLYDINLLYTAVSRARNEKQIILI